MSFDRSRRGHAAADDAARASSAPGPGKQTLVPQLAAPPVQRRAAAGAAGETDQVHAAAAHGTSGPAGQLPYLDQIQRSFGRHDVGHVQAHADGRAAEGAGAMGADGFAVGEHVAFAGAPDLHTAAHEAAHVVQQRGGVQLKGGVGEAGDAYEQHADAVADLVVQGKSSEALLDQHAGPRAAAAGGAVQRHVFVGGKQIKKSDKVATGDVAALVTDDLIRSYESVDELQRHAAGQTDYLGNLADGTWLRFSPTGLNVLGEMHEDVTLRMVTRAVGTTNFIDERIARDKLPAGQLKTAYEAQAASTFKEFGIEGEADKEKHGAESLFPKMGFALSSILPYLDGKKPTDELKKPDYGGQVYQRYLKLSWAHAKDVKAQVAVMQGIGRELPPAQTRLAKVVAAVEPDVDRFITDLPSDGWLGDALDRRDAQEILLSLAIFARAFLHEMVERAVADPSSRLDDQQKARFSRGASDDDTKQLFSDLRNFQFEDSVKQAAQDGVRYAGMGWAHWDHLRKIGLPAGSHGYDMNGDDIERFRTETGLLRRRAVKQ